MTTIAAAAGGLTWVLFDYRTEKKLSALGFCSGVVAALVTITPASGYVAPWASIVIGFIGGIVCNLSSRLKHVLGYDDALDAFGVHGVGGVVGNILTGIFAQKWVASLDDSYIRGGWLDGNWIQVAYQLAGATAGAAWSFTVTAIILLIMQHVPWIVMKLPEEDEILGVDLAEMGEAAYIIYENNSMGARKFSVVPTNSALSLKIKETLSRQGSIQPVDMMITDQNMNIAKF